MIPSDSRFIQDSRRVLHAQSLTRLYYLAQSIHHELTTRGLGARLEAAALELALLAELDQRELGILRVVDLDSTPP